MYLSDYRTQVRNALDVASDDDHYTDAYLNYCINAEVQTITSELMRYESEYVNNIIKVDLSTATNYASSFEGIKIYLPSGFGGIINVRYQATSTSTPEPVALVPDVVYDSIEESSSVLSDTGCNWMASITGDPTGIKLHLYPDPQGIGYLWMRYRFIPTSMTTDTSTSGLPPLLDDLIVLGAALRASVKSIEPDRISKLQTDYLTKRQVFLPVLGNISGGGRII